MCPDGKYSRDYSVNELNACYADIVNALSVSEKVSITLVPYTAF